MKCQHPDCPNNETVTACFYPDNHTEIPDEYYCSEHSFEHGYCFGCGQFWSGVERFDFATTYGGILGLCENCDDEFRTDLGEFDEEDEFDDRYAYADY